MAEDEVAGWLGEDLEEWDDEEENTGGLEESLARVQIQQGPLTMKLFSPGWNQYGDNQSIQTKHFQGSTGSTYEGLDSPAWSSLTGNSDATTLVERILTNPNALALMRSKLNEGVPPQQRGGEKE